MAIHLVFTYILPFYVTSMYLLFVVSEFVGGSERFITQLTFIVRHYVSCVCLSCCLCQLWLNASIKYIHRGSVYQQFFTVFNLFSCMSVSSFQLDNEYIQECMSKSKPRCDRKVGTLLTKIIHFHKVR